MVGAVLAGEGLERIAEIASSYAGAPVAIVVPRLEGSSQRPEGVAAEVPIVTGGQQLGSVLLLGAGVPEAGEYMHMAAVAALTEVAVAEAREETEHALRGSLIEELLTRTDLDPDDLLRRARRMGADLSEERWPCARIRASGPPATCWRRSPT